MASRWCHARSRRRSLSWHRKWISRNTPCTPTSRSSNPSRKRSRSLEGSRSDDRTKKEKIGMAYLCPILCFLPLLSLCTVCLSAQTVNHASSAIAIDVQPAELLAKPAQSNWPSYNGDYTGRRYSTLQEITTKNVGN